MAGAVTAAKQILVLDVRSPHGLVRKFETKGGLVCPHFYIVGTMVNGCFYSCEYCYLQGTYRSVHPFIKLAINYDDVFDAMKATARKNKRADLVTNFNAGELMDSLSFEDVTGFIGELIPKMTGDDFERSELMLLTKSANVEALVSAAEEHPEAIERVIPTWSINSPRAASCYEHAAPGTEQRLEAAKRVQDAGYKTRLRIDPMVPYEGWEDDYRDLVRSIYGEYGLQPQVITLGTLRYESAVPAIARKRFRHTNLFDFPLVKKGEDKQRLRYAERLAMYRHVVDAIRAFDDDQKNRPVQGTGRSMGRSRLRHGT
ncbi:MAG: hypothetical protein M5R36_28325 [Deltaproteobacteria bacterium]|nr:hypothetical protein [Deltaproteobacteria bacterium]